MRQLGTMAVRENVPLMRAQVRKHCVERRLAENVPGTLAIGRGKKEALYKLFFFRKPLFLHKRFFRALSGMNPANKAACNDSQLRLLKKTSIEKQGQMLRPHNYYGLLARNPWRTSNKNSLPKITHLHHPPRQGLQLCLFSPEGYRSDEEWLVTSRILDSSHSLIQITLPNRFSYAGGGRSIKVNLRHDQRGAWCAIVQSRSQSF